MLPPAVIAAQSQGIPANVGPLPLAPDHLQPVSGAQERDATLSTVTGSVGVQKDVQNPILQRQGAVLAPTTSVPAQPPISHARAVHAPVFAPAISAPPISVQDQPPIVQAIPVNAPVFAPPISAPPISVQAQLPIAQTRVVNAPVFAPSIPAPIISVQAQQPITNAAMPQQFPAAQLAVFQPAAYPAMPRQHLKPLQLPKFAGRGTEYVRWRQHFQVLVDNNNTIPDYFQLARLHEFPR